MAKKDQEHNEPSPEEKNEQAEGLPAEDQASQNLPKGEARSAEEHFEKGSGDVGQDEVQEKKDEAEEKGYEGGDEAYDEYAKRKNEALSLPDPGPLKAE